jgi:hypothetical protein
LGATLNMQVLSNVFVARARRHGSALDAALFESNMPVAVYRQLVEQAHAGPARRCTATSGCASQMLGITGAPGLLRQLPAAGAARPREQRFDIEHSRAIMLAALAAAGRRVPGPAEAGLCITLGGQPSAAGQGLGRLHGKAAPYDVHPYLLLNHNDDYQSSVHSWPTSGATPCTRCWPTPASPSRRPTTRPSSPSRPPSATRCCCRTTSSASARTPGRKDVLSGRGPGVDPHHLLPPGDVRRISARHARRSGSRPCRCRARACRSCTVAWALSEKDQRDRRPAHPRHHAAAAARAPDPLLPDRRHAGGDADRGHARGHPPDHAWRRRPAAGDHRPVLDPRPGGGARVRAQAEGRARASTRASWKS